MAIQIPEEDLDEILEGVVDEIERPAAEEICTMREPSKDSGSDGYETLKSELPEEGYGMDVPPGAEVQQGETEFKSFDWNATKQVGSRWVTVEDENEMGEYDRDAVTHELTKATTQSLFNIERKLATILVDDTKNGTKSANGKWDDEGASSYPYKTISKAIEDNDVIAPTEIVIAPDVVEGLRTHPDSKEQDANYSGGGQVPFDLVVNKLRQAHRMIKEVHVFGPTYDAAAAGLPVQYSDLFSGNVWIGNKADLLYYFPEIENNPYQMQSPNARRSGIDLTVGHFCDFKRPRKDLGLFLKESGTAGVL